MAVRTTRATIPLRVPALPNITVLTVPTYADLPESAADGTLTEVLTGDGRGLWRHRASVGGDSVGIWFPGCFIIDDYDRDAGGNPTKISTANGIGGDDLAALISRGWINNAGAPATIADAGGDIELKTNGGGGNPTFSFVPASAQTGWYLGVFEAEVIANAAGAGFLGAYYAIADNLTTRRLSLTHSSLPNEFSFVKDFNVGIGFGKFSFSAFERIFAVLLLGNFSVTLSRLHSAWPAKSGGPFPPNNELATADTSEFSVGGFGTGLSSGSQAGTTWRIREFHLFKLV